MRTEQVVLADAARRLWPEPEGMFAFEPLHFLLDCAPASTEPLEFLPEAERFTFRAGADVEGWFRLLTSQGAIFAGSDRVAVMLESVVLTALTWTHLMPLHAGCVARNGHTLLLCGDSHAGKSTLAYTLTRQGWTYISENSLYWAFEEGVLVSGSPTIKLRGQEQRIDPRREGWATSRAACLGPSVFLKRRPGPARLTRHEEDDALIYFLSYATRPDREFAAQRYRDLSRRGLWRIEYEHAEDAARCLEQLV